MECLSVSLALQRKRRKASSFIENGNKDRVCVHYNKSQLPPSILPTKQQRGGTRVSFRSEEAWQWKQTFLAVLKPEKKRCAFHTALKLVVMGENSNRLLWGNLLSWCHTAQTWSNLQHFPFEWDGLHGPCESQNQLVLTSHHNPAAFPLGFLNANSKLTNLRYSEFSRLMKCKNFFSSDDTILRSTEYMICVGSEEGKKLHVLVLAWTGENSGFQINLAHTARTQSGWALELLLVLYSAFKHPLSFWLKISCPNEVTFTLADCWRTQHAIISYIS